MSVRRPCVAGQFYEGDGRSCLRHVKECLAAARDQDLPKTAILGGIVPHAGWTFSGPTAARVFLAIAASQTPATFVLLGADHRGVGPRPKLFSEGAWSTPLGEIAIDEELAGQLSDRFAGELERDEQAHSHEHSLEVQVPFVQHLFPGARLCPITVPPESSAHEFGGKLAAVLAPRRAEIVVIGSTDLTHYGPNYWFDPKGVGDQALEWVKTVNDRRIVDLAIDLACDQIVTRALAEHSACGAGAMAATTAYCKAAGCPRGVLLHYTTSHDVMPERRPSSFVGYAGIVFPAPAA